MAHNWTTTAIVTDHGGLTASITVTIVLTDVNEAPFNLAIAPLPYTSSSPNAVSRASSSPVSLARTTGGSINGVPASSFISLREDIVPGSAIARVSASDVDAGWQGALRYELTRNEDSTPFVIDTATGVIRISNSSGLDFEDQWLWSPEVVVSDSSPSPLSIKTTVVIEVTDIDDVAITSTSVLNGTDPACALTTDGSIYAATHGNMSLLASTNGCAGSVVLTGANLGWTAHRYAKEGIDWATATGAQSITTFEWCYGGVSAAYPGDGCDLVTRRCSVLVPYSQIVCSIGPGAGLDKFISLDVCHADVTPQSITSGPSSSSSWAPYATQYSFPAIKFGYLPPTIIAVTLTDLTALYTTLSTRGNTSIFLAGSNFGRTGDSVITVRYGPVTGQEYSATGCVVVDPVHVRCWGVPGVGGAAGLSFNARSVWTQDRHPRHSEHSTCVTMPRS